MSEPGRAVVVAALDEQPLRLGAGAGALEGEAAVQLLAVQDEDGVAALQRLRPGDPAALLVGPAVPHDHVVALVVVVAHAVVLDLHGQALGGGIQRRPLGHGPGAHDAVDLQAQVVVVGGRLVLLDDEHPGAHAADRELLVALDARALGLDRVADERQERLDGVGRALGVDLAGRAHPAHHRQLAGPGGHGLGVDPAAGGRAQRTLTSG